MWKWWGFTCCNKEKIIILPPLTELNFLDFLLSLYCKAVEERDNGEEIELQSNLSEHRRAQSFCSQEMPVSSYFLKILGTTKKKNHLVAQYLL